MTLAQILLVPLVVLALIDLAMTLKGLALGLEEKNVLAVRVMQRLGTVRGLVVYQLAAITFFAGVVLLFPSQWALPLVMVVEQVLLVWSNARYIKNAPRQAVA